MLELANAPGGRRLVRGRPLTETATRHVAIIGNFPPRRCGIATFTADLVTALTEGGDIACDVYAVTDKAADYDFPDIVKYTIREDEAGDYIEAARRINSSPAEFVIVQHEYGLFGAHAGEKLLQLLARLRKPIVTTLHTALAAPNDDQRRVMDGIVARSARVVVMSRKGRDLLQSVHNVPASKLVVIPHGAPDRPFMGTAPFKEELGLTGRDVILTFGLLSPNKGLETLIRALPALKAQHPNVLYVVLGATHPRLIERDGEAYRDSLVRIARELGVLTNVRFVNEYTDTEKLLDYIGAADIYATPYLNECQVTSGTLSYAVALGKPVVSTPYWHARELLAQGRGILVPFGDVTGFADALHGLLNDNQKCDDLRRRAYAAGRETTWPRVASRYLTLLDDTKETRPKPVTTKAPVPLSPTTYAGVEAMTDSCGILQHTVHCVPNRDHGYSLDDNARALILMNRLDKLGHRSARTDQLSLIYAAYLQHSWNPKAGAFRNFMSFDRRWLEEEGSQDSCGRTVWALGSTMEQSSNERLKGWARPLLSEALPHVAQYRYIRSQAFAVLGLCHWLSAEPQCSDARDVVQLHCRTMHELLRRQAVPAWPWFEDGLFYDNARLCEMMIRGGSLLGDRFMIEAGLRSLKWLFRMQSCPQGHFQAVGTEGFSERHKPPQRFDQQPVEALATIDAAKVAFMATGDSEWCREAERAYEWFRGANCGGERIERSTEGVCLDGLTRDGVNQNQGAESVLSFALATCEMHSLHSSLGRAVYALA